MAVLQSVNGKAPAGAKVGDTIVTNGGSFQITGKRADGSWISQKVSSVSKNSAGGSAAGVTTSTPTQAQIKAQMNANSQAWHTASAEERTRLHEENERLAALLGGSVRYDGATGTWSGASEATDVPLESQAAQSAVTDNRAYLEEMAASYLQAQKAALEDAYAQNVSDLQAEQDRLGAGYRAARNQEAAESALARQRFQETAAAYGLNSGTAGQANLRFSNQLQSDLSALQAGEAEANAEIERQRSDLARTYRSAMVQAQAENDYRLFDKLYSEAVRVDQALRQQSQFNAGMALQQYQTLLDQYNADRSYRYRAEQDRLAMLQSEAALAAKAGDYSLYGSYYGWDDGRVQQMNDLWTAANTPKTRASGGSRSSGGGSRSSSDQSGDGYESPYVAMHDQGVRTYADAYAYLVQRKYSSTAAEKMAKSYATMLEDGTLGGSAALGEAAQALLGRLNRSRLNSEAKVAAIDRAQAAGSITAAEAAAVREAVL